MRAQRQKVFRVLGVGLLTMAALSGCRKEMPAAPGGIPDRSDTQCERLKEHELGAAESAFSCRGVMVSGSGSLVGAVRSDKAGTFELFSISPQGALGVRQATSHQGERMVLLPLSGGGVLAVSAQDKVVRVSLHDEALSGEFKAQELPITNGSAKAFDAVALGDGALVAVATGHGVRAWRVGADGQAAEALPGLSHPEMPYCARLYTGAGDGGVRVTLRCQDVVPLAPELVGGEAKIPDFNYDAEEPPRTDIHLAYNADGSLGGVVAEPGGDEPPPARYEVKRYLKEQLPRPAQHRAHILDGAELGQDRYVALACTGPDEGPVKVDLALVQCQPPPQPEAPAAP